MDLPIIELAGSPKSMGEAFGILYNAAMEIERSQLQGASRYGQSENPIGQGNGCFDYSMWGRKFLFSTKISC